MHAAKTAHCHSESELSQTRELTAILYVHKSSMSAVLYVRLASVLLANW